MDTKNYILSIQATLKGDKVVLTGLQQIEGQTEKFKKTVSVTGDKTQDFNDILLKAGQRALIVAPIWLAIRTAMMLALGTISDMTKANIDLEDGMARIQTVLQGSASEIDAQMIGIKRTILDTSLTTSISIKDLAEGFYFLKSSALSAEEAMAGFQPLVNIITGTNVSAMEASRGLAGMYNTLGNSLGDNLNPTEKMNKIADTLTYTYAKQDVEMGELISGYSKLAPYLVGLDDNFTDVVTTLGFLNTHMLRGARAGTLTGQSIISMIKSTEKLSSVFGITFDSKKPISFLNTIDQIHNKMGDTSQLTAEQSKAIQDISATRGGVPIRLILGNYEDFKSTLKDAEQNVEGFAKKIADIKMNTVTSQMGELRNVLAVLSNDFFTGATSGQGFVVFIRELNEVLTAMRPLIKEAGNEWGYFIELLQRGTVVGMASTLLGGALPVKPRSYKDYLKETEKNTEITKKDNILRDTFEKLSQSRQDYKLYQQEDYKESLRSTYEIMKANGASDLDIQKQKVAEFTKAENKLNTIDELTKEITTNEELQKTALGEASYTLQGRIMLLQQELLAQTAIQTVRESYGSEEEFSLAKQKEENNLLVEQVKYRKTITDNMRNVGLELLKTMGTSESQIITMKMKELEVDRQSMGEGAYRAQMEGLRLSRIQAIVGEKLKERQIQANLILDYQKGNEFERANIRKLIELRKLTPDELTEKYKKSPEEAKLIEENLSKFSPEGQDAIIKMFAEKNKLDYEDVKSIISDASKDTNPEVAENSQALRNLTDILRDLNTNIGVGANRGDNSSYFNSEDIVNAQKSKDQFGQVINIPFSTAIANININLPDNALASLAEEAGRRVTEELTNNEELAKKIASIVRPYV